jgi:hypothetical protein
MTAGGDPLTPFLPSHNYTYRAETVDGLRARHLIPNIPVMPIGYRDAVKIVRSMNGNDSVPTHWKGAMNATYVLTSSHTYQLRVSITDDTRVRIEDVCATLYGRDEPDRYVLLGACIRPYAYAAHKHR